MAQKRAAIEQLIKKATEAKIKKFEAIRGKQIINFPYWDIVVITAADADQLTAYNLQLKQKLARQQLPLGIKYHVLKDPGDCKIGPGGSMMAALSWLQTIYNQTLFKKRVLFIPAGGFSQRLPSASLLGKIFTAVPCGKPIFQMLELILAMYIDLPVHMESGGIFLACADTIILYDSTVGVEWSFDKPGITAFGHPAPIEVGTTHGVFLLPEDKELSHIHIVECEEFLHKRSADNLREKGALLRQSCRETLGIVDDYVLVDSSYFMDWETAKKLIDFYEEKSPLTCEIDSHGDFLHGLGNCGSSSYINDTSNVHIKTDELLSMRQEVFRLLQGTPLHVLVLPHSKFYHIGTTQELLHHYCNNWSLANELDLSKDTFNRSVQPESSSSGSQGKPRKACIMNSYILSHTDTSSDCVVEYCTIKSPCTLSEGCIISNCVIQASNPSDHVVIPPSMFFHTASVTLHENTTQYVTIFFNIRDNLKGSVSQGQAAQLPFLNKSFQDIFRNDITKAIEAIFPPGVGCCLWNAKLFPAMPTMEKSFQAAMTFLTKAQVDSQSPLSSMTVENLSMADVLQYKDIESMLDYRKQLYSHIMQA
ncbi:fucose-1-phosphate guanylyltransferase-like [Diadema antillarum]|uniref:fucose-1-phosphate guanylyltransferase-like n=1 Tax=Diadema antillarum TaxID=105358 RepID=UPI003A841AD9